MEPLYTTTGISTGDGRNGRVALADGTLEFALGREDGGYNLTVTLTASIPELTVAEVREVIEEAHEICPYSKATRGNIPVTITVG